MCFLADAADVLTRKSRTANITITHLAFAVRIYFSFADLGHNRGGGHET